MRQYDDPGERERHMGGNRVEAERLGPNRAELKDPQHQSDDADCQSPRYTHNLFRLKRTGSCQCRP